MNFRYVLKLFALEGHGVALTSSSFAGHLLSRLPEEYKMDKSFVRQFNSKRVSGDLDRLYKMGLMTRKRVKRSIVTSRGTELWRGFQYEYRISKQGWQYINFLAKPKNMQPSALDQVEEASRRIIIEDLYKRVPEPVADYLAGAFADKEFDDRGRHRRFPKRDRMRLINELSECRARLKRKSREVNRLLKQINGLKNAHARN